MMRQSTRLGLGCAVAFAAMYPAAPAAAQRPGPHAVTPVPGAAGALSLEIYLNGRKLADGVRAGAPPATDEVLVAVHNLARAIDGDSGSKEHLRLSGDKLFAVAMGACEGCVVAVARTVLISSRVRAVAGVPHLPLGDLVAAFEGRLEVDEPNRVYHVYTGRCSWCILAPAPRRMGLAPGPTAIAPCRAR